ncbi:hypothetical protein [Chryseobacterium hagamense]|uniref:Uncharacterized protein n=1 Tax=Chryseobacterium hagamense TaxID=395935 RepID=A0A511YS72_9FLAO|nr:hypothetical protein [Chryseobacterium hagamense]GEN78043.1 hypothetical protein CHA01nite_37830 [Chryseobacterium hagamense]
MQSKAKKRKFRIPAGPVPVPGFMLGSLSEEEYRNPCLVFRKTFSELTLREFDGFLSDITCFSLGTFQKGPEEDLVTPFLHLNRMLDATQLIVERAAMVSDNEK